MGTTGTGVIRAAGGVLWRRDSGGQVEVALVHRPRYDDWSLPKGKLEPDEPPLVGALREVREETGHVSVAGRSLGTSRYDVLQDGRLLPKTVRWWALRAGDGRFVPSEEVDELRWLTPDAAEQLLTAGRDVAPLRLLVDRGLDTTTVVLVRHGRAGDRKSWAGEDLQRPLDGRGNRQAARLAQLLVAYGPARLLSAPPLRCRQTLEPLAAATGLQIRTAEAVGEQAASGSLEPALGLLKELAQQPGTSVVCSQGGVLPALVLAVAEGSGIDVGRAPSRKGSSWALSWSRGVLVDADSAPPLA